MCVRTRTGTQLLYSISLFVNYTYKIVTLVMSQFQSYVHPRQALNRAPHRLPVLATPAASQAIGRVARCLMRLPGSA